MPRTNNPTRPTALGCAMRALLMGLLAVLTACSAQATVTDTDVAEVLGASTDQGTANSQADQQVEAPASSGEDTDQTGGDRAGDGEGGGEPVPQPTPAPEPTPSPQIYDTLAVDMHPGGVQAQVRRMTFTADSTTVLVQLVNGREFDTRLFASRTQTSLFDASGREYPAEPLEDIEVPEQAIVELPLLQFPPIDPAAGPFRLRYNFRDDDQGISDANPGFDIDAIDVNAPIASLPADFGMADTASHEFGMQVRLFGFAFTETSIGLAAEVINGGPQSASFNRGRYEGFLEDDLGNRYQLELPPGSYQLRVDEGERQPGVLVYAGRIHPDATSISGVLNNTGEPDGRSLSPRLAFGPYNLDGSTPPAGGSINAITQVQQFTHPNGADFVMSGITFRETGTIVNLLTENDDRTVPIRLALSGKTYLLDDLGNRYEILPPPDNRSLQIPGGAGLDAELSFPGAINLDASTIEVVINGGQDAEQSNVANSGFPEARFGPFPLTRSAAVPGLPPASVPAVTTMGIEALEGSEAAPLTLIFDEFDGRLVSGGVLLTLPQDILFDSGSAQLRSASRDAISKIVQITEFYAGDPMTVIGHTDSDGDDASNQALSEQRAASVVDALIAAGANASLIAAEGRGESEPVQSNDTDAGKQANRRVEVFFATNKGLPS